MPPFKLSSGLQREAVVSGLELARASVPTLEWLAVACKMGWMAIAASQDLPAAARLVRTLAALCCQPLVEIPLTPTSDVSDLLGGFEQQSVGRLLSAAEARIQHAAAVMCRSALGSCAAGKHKSAAAVEVLQQLCKPHIAGGATAEADAAVPALREALAGLQAIHSAGEWSAHTQGSLLELLVAAEAALSEAEALLIESAESSMGGRFVWVDGLLLSAIEQGHWVLMLHANTCSAAVLDRLNSLLEPSGELFVNECGLGAGGPRVVRPHTNFRLFLVLDPTEGGLSRAMRNRGIEVYFDAHQFSARPAEALCQVCPADTADHIIACYGLS